MTSPRHAIAEEIAKERHYVTRAGWLRAAVMGGNDGIVSTASLIIGVAAADAGQTSILLAGVAGLIAGAMSMAAGEYVSVSSQADSEHADLRREQLELDANPHGEHRELSDIYVERGLERGLADDVATQLMEHDALATHAREELGISDLSTARPIQAAVTSALTFSAGAALPLMAVLFAPLETVILWTTIVSILVLGFLGATSAVAGGAPVLRAVFRVTVWGALAMGATALVGHWFGVAVG
jgi:VIT1/CCC1 family predicted Fe2+/Mn2+ transporter